MKVVAVQDAAGDRVEKGFGTFRLLVVGEQADERLFDRLPVVDLLWCQVAMLFLRHALSLVEHVVDLIGAFTHPDVVVFDPLFGHPLDAVPVMRFKQGLGALGHIAEQGIMPIKSGQDLLRHFHRWGKCFVQLLYELMIGVISHDDR